MTDQYVPPDQIGISDEDFAHESEDAANARDLDKGERIVIETTELGDQAAINVSSPGDGPTGNGDQDLDDAAEGAKAAAETVVDGDIDPFIEQHGEAEEYPTAAEESAGYTATDSRSAPADPTFSG